ncbi:MAG: chromosome segregation protein SMC [Archaeoglobaceae archaeon]
MLLKKISLRNFKSFSKKVEIPLNPGFTVVTGPNGSGKSNIIDSILFCLGLTTSTKQLRAERLSDLISEGKKEAEVSITIGGNERNYEITRRIKVTDKGYYSYYYINDKPVSFYEVQNLLSEFGIYSEAYNVVMQGDVTRIVEMSPVQRRRIIEDVAGISEFDEKKERALEELDRVRENIEKLEAVIAEVEGMLKSLEKDRNEALRYKELVAKKIECETQIKAHEFLSLNSNKKRIEDEIERLEKEKDRLMAKIPEITQRTIKINEDIKSIANEISRFGDERLSEIQTEILRMTSEIESIRKSEKIYQEEIERIDGEILRKRSEIVKLRDELESIQRRFDEEVIKKINLDELIGEISSKLESLRRELESEDKSYQELKNKLVSEKERLEVLKDRRNALISERDRNIELLRRIEIELEDAVLEKEKIKKKLEEDKTNLEKISTELLKLEKDQKDLQSELFNLDKNLFSIRSRLSDVEEEMKRCEVELAKIKAKLSTIQSYSKPVEMILSAKERRELAGIFGTVAQLGEVDEKFATAIESAIGGALQFIVVETEDDAVEAIKYLKMLQAGRASFIPLRKIRDFKVELDEEVLKEKGVIDFAVNLVKCEKKFLPVFRFLLKDTVVVDTIDNARKLMDKNLRLVTLDGDLVEKSGLMVGGSRERRGLIISRELVERERELQERIRELQSEKDSLIANLNNVEERRRSVKNKLEEIGAKINERKMETKGIEERIRGFYQQLNEIEGKIAQRGAEKSECIEKLKKINEEVSNVEKEIRDVETAIREVENELKGSRIPEIVAELDKLKDEYSRNREILVAIEKKIENLEFQRRQLENTLNSISNEISSLSSRKSEIALKLEEGKKRVEELSRKIEELKSEEKKLGERVKELRDRRDSLLGELRALEEEKSKVDFELRRCEDRISSLKEKLSAILESISSFGSFMIPENLRGLDDLKAELLQIEDELSSFGDVNLKAIQDYENVKARRDELMSKKEILEKERREIIERIERYEQKKREVFFEVFNAVNRNFRQILQELADGEGELFLDSEDVFNSGLQMRVKLGNKPMQKLEALSGGEKSLVALSFILAIQMFKPAPFYAFDEVDMFLDGVNVERVAKMIKKRSKDAQFIVVSLRKPMIENADTVIGVTMGGDNSSIVTGIRMNSPIQSKSS